MKWMWMAVGAAAMLLVIVAGGYFYERKLGIR